MAPSSQELPGLIGAAVMRECRLTCLAICAGQAIVLVVVATTIVAVFVALGMMPGHIARKRGHPWAHAVTVGGWATLIFGFAGGAPTGGDSQLHQPVLSARRLDA